MAVLSLGTLSTILRQLHLSETDLVAEADDPDLVALLLRDQRALDRVQLALGRIESGVPPGFANRSNNDAHRIRRALRHRERKLGKIQHNALTRYLTSPIPDVTGIRARLVVLLATLEPGLAASTLRTIIAAMSLPRSRK